MRPIHREIHCPTRRGRGGRPEREALPSCSAATHPVSSGHGRGKGMREILGIRSVLRCNRGAKFKREVATGKGNRIKEPRHSGETICICAEPKGEANGIRRRRDGRFKGHGRRPRQDSRS